MRLFVWSNLFSFCLTVLPFFCSLACFFYFQLFQPADSGQMYIHYKFFLFVCYEIVFIRFSISSTICLHENWGMVLSLLFCCFFFVPYSVAMFRFARVTFSVIILWLEPFGTPTYGLCLADAFVVKSGMESCLPVFSEFECSTFSWLAASLGRVLSFLLRFWYVSFDPKLRFLPRSGWLNLNIIFYL